MHRLGNDSPERSGLAAAGMLEKKGMLAAGATHANPDIGNTRRIEMEPCRALYAFNNHACLPSLESGQLR